MLEFGGRVWVRVSLMHGIIMSLSSAWGEGEGAILGGRFGVKGKVRCEGEGSG